MALLFTQLTQFTDNNTGAPLANGSLVFYDTGTSTPKAIYSDAELTTAAGVDSVVTLDAAGRSATNIYVADGERFTVLVLDATGTTVETIDDVWGAAEEAASALYTPANGVSRTLQSKFDELVSITDFMTTAQRSDYTGGLATVDIRDALVNAFASGERLYMPAGAGLVDGTLNMPTGLTLIGAGRSLCSLKLADGADAPFFNHNDAITDVWLEGFTMDGNRAGQAGGTGPHTLRSNNSLTRGTFRDLIIKNGYTYNIGFQEGDYTDLLFENLYLEGSGDDGIDFKNTADGSTVVNFRNIYVNGFDALAGGGNAGIDLRGECHLSHIWVNFGSTTTGSGVRFRSGAALSASGLGAHESSISNVHIKGNDNTTIGISVGAEDVTIQGGHIKDCYRDIIATGARGTVSGITTDTALDYSIHLQSGAVDWAITGNIINTPANDCIRIDSGADGAVVTGNRMIMGAGGVECAADNVLVDANNFSGTGTQITFSGSGCVAGDNVGASEETLNTSTETASPTIPSSLIDSSSTGVGITLGDGHRVGFIKTFVMTDASNSSTVTVTNHATTDGEIGTFAAVDATWVLIWTGTEWATLYSDGVTGL